MLLDDVLSPPELENSDGLFWGQRKEGRERLYTPNYHRIYDNLYRGIVSIVRDVMSL